MPYKVEVQADNSRTWASNALAFKTREEAEAYARDLHARWTAVREWRVVVVQEHRPFPVSRNPISE